MIRYLTAGESHGPCLVGILEGMPAGLEINEEEIAVDLRRRQLGYGRGERMRIESDHAKILSGVRYGATLGSPIALLIENKDWPNWTTRLCSDSVPDDNRAAPLTTPRPGHADFAGAIKFHHRDIRSVIERASARETAMRAALAAICRKFFRELGITVASHVVEIGNAPAANHAAELSPDEINHRADQNAVRCLEENASLKMIEAIDGAREKGDTVGGVFEVVCAGLPVGIGSYAHGDRRLDAILSAALMSIPAVKTVAVGSDFQMNRRFGSEAHDRMYPDRGGVMRKTNFAGGIEGGMTNGETLIIRAAMKPLASLAQPLETVDLATSCADAALRERSDVCAVPAAAVVGEAMFLLSLMNPFMEKYGGDSMREVKNHLKETTGSPWD